MSEIRLSTAANIRSFQVLLNTPSPSGNVLDRASFEDEFGRLRVWSGNLGALQMGHSSLDYRLRDSPLLSSNTLKLLRELEQNLTETTAIISGARLPYEQQTKPDKGNDEDDGEDDDFFSDDESGDSDGGRPKTELGMRLAEVRDIIDNLYKLSVRIRQPTIKSRSLRAASYQPKDPDTGVDLFEQYAFFDLQHTRELIRHLRMDQGPDSQVEGSEAKRDDALVARLARAVTLRRRQFKYWSRHRAKLGTSATLDEPYVAPQAKRLPDVERRDTQEAQQVSHPTRLMDEAPSRKTGRTLLSGTEATHHHQSLDDVFDSKSVTSYATTVRDLTGKGIDLPPPPKTADGEKDFECPYCFTICPARYGKGRPWRTHLLHDLQPYVCTYEDCIMSEQLFRSRKDWAQHEAGHRKVWRCPEHPNAVYKSSNGLRDHLHHSHGGSFPVAQLDSIVSVGETTTVDTRPNCPICRAQVDIDDMNLQSHLANHLERIAAFALPNDCTDDVDGASSQASGGRSGSSGSPNLSSVDWSGTEDTEDVDGAISDKEITSKIIAVSPSSALKTPETAGAGLSELLLRQLPDERANRLNILFSNQRADDVKPRKNTTQGDLPDAEEHITQRLFAYAQTLEKLPGVEFACSSRGSQSWKFRVRFKDKASATQALIAIDKTQFPGITLRQHRHSNVLYFSVKIKENRGEPTERSPEFDADELESASTASVTTCPDDSNSMPPTLTAEQIQTIRSLYRSGVLRQRDEIHVPNDSYNQIISFCSASLVSLKVDAIINSSNRSMKKTSYSTTLNNAVHKAAGPELAKATSRLRKLKAGEAIVTKGYRLPSAHIIHVCRPQHAGKRAGKSESGEWEILAQCYQNALLAANDCGFKTIALPLLGAGGLGFPPRAATRIALREVRGFLDSHKDHSFEKIAFTAYNSIEERALEDFIPVFFPPTHGDLENAMPREPNVESGAGNRLSKQVTQAFHQVAAVSQNLLNAITPFDDFTAGHRTWKDLSEIALLLSTINEALLETHDEMMHFSDRITTHVEHICNVLGAVCSTVNEVVELIVAKERLKEIIWADHNAHMKTSQGLDLLQLLELCNDFLRCLDDMLARGHDEPYEMRTMSIRLGSWLAKSTGRGNQSLQNHFDEVLYARQFQQSASSLTRTDTVKLHQLPSIARLYQAGKLKQTATHAIPSSRMNHIISLIREDITKLEVDVIVNSTNPTFHGSGTLDWTIQRKGGPELMEELSSFGTCQEGTVKTTRGYLLPAKYILHVIPPEVYVSSAKDSLRRIYREILLRAASLSASSIAIPTIGTGLLSYPARDSAALAMEEVKGFLESMEFMSLEKIIFVVYTSNDEYIYKSLLPYYFPPIDTNVNRPLPAGNVPMNRTSNSAEPSEPPRRSIFRSIGDAVRGVRFGKELAELSMRPLNPLENLALISFETHTRNCDQCIRMESVHYRMAELCEEGHALGRNVLGLLYMGPDQQVYSTSTKDGQESPVQVPLEFPLSWKLLSIAKENPSRHPPLITSNQPWSELAGHQKRNQQNLPNVTMQGSKVVVHTQTEEVLALVDVWSEESHSWEPLQPREALLRIYPGKLLVYSLDGETVSQPLLLALELSPSVQITRSESLELIIANARTFEEAAIKSSNQIRLRSRDPPELQVLMVRLLHAAKADKVHAEHLSAQDSSEKSISELEVLLPSVPHSDPSQAGRDSASSPENKEAGTLQAHLSMREALNKESAEETDFAPTHVQDQTDEADTTADLQTHSVST